jgi:hypothetical protein
MFCVLLCCAPLLVGCFEACTEADCTDSVTITFENLDSVQGLSMQLTLADGSHLDIQCPALSSSPEWRCQGNSVLLWKTPRYLDLTVSAPSGSYSGRITPKYEKLYPNGPDCAPMCGVATVSVPLQ